MMSKIILLCERIARSPRFVQSVIGLILLNAVLIGLETYPALYKPYAEWFHIIDKGILWLFTLEIVIKLLAARFSWRYWQDGWNVFDILIVLSGHLLAGAPFVTLLRIVRIFRIFRTITVVPSLKKLTNALLMTLPSLGTIFLLMSLVFYVYGVLGTLLYRDLMPEYFGNLQLTLLTLFQVVTLEAWASEVMRPLMAMDASAWIYCVSFVLIGTFVVFNLFVGVIVSNVEKADQEEEVAKDPQSTAQVQYEELKRELAEIKQMLKEK